MSYDHSEGPWIADDNEGFGQWTIWSKMSPTGSGAAGLKIATVHGDSAEADSNARLLAASPHLLKAVLHCEELLMRYEINRVDGDEISDNALKVIREALAKVKGD